MVYDLSLEIVNSQSSETKECMFGVHGLERGKVSSELNPFARGNESDIRMEIQQ
jgi:hypothetical protein